MANTVIALKKSATPSATPSSLANGELAINYADGKLYYKNANGTIVAFSAGGNAFATVNANNTLVVADGLADILTLEAGDNISIVGDAVNDKVTVGLKNNVVITGTFFMNNFGGGGSPEGGEILLANSTSPTQSLSGPIVVDIYENRLRFFERDGTNRGVFIEFPAAGGGASTNLLATSGSSTDTTARDWAASAFAKANAALPNTTGVTFAGNLTVSQNLIADRVITNNNGNGENVKIGDDAWIGDTNLADTVRLKGQQNASNGYIMFGINDGIALGRQGANALTYGGNTVWHAGNDGAGSTLDADLLDGQHGSYYGIATDVTAAFGQANTARTHANNAFNTANNALPNTTATFNGTLTVSGDFITRGNVTLGDSSTDTITINGTTISLGNNQSIDAGTLFIDSVNNEVGIGITNPTSNLHVIGTANITSFLIVNTTNVEPTIVASFGQANTARVHANAAHLTANAGFDQANTARVHANAAFLQANTARDGANTALTTGQSAFNAANIGWSQANTALSTGQAAFNAANIAWATANGRFSSNGGTITGDVSIVGTLSISGNTLLQNVTTLTIGDPLIYLAANNYISDTVDIGFIANYVNATGSNVHTGLYREHADKMYYLFQGYDKEPANNHIGALSNNMTLAILNADLRTDNLWISGINSAPWITAAFAKANNALANTSGTTFDGVLNVSGNVTTQGLNVTSNVINFGTAMSILANGMMIIKGDINMLG